MQLQGAYRLPRSTWILRACSLEEHTAMGSTQLSWEHSAPENMQPQEAHSLLGSMQLRKAHSSGEQVLGAPGSLEACSYGKHTAHPEALSSWKHAAIESTQTHPKHDQRSCSLGPKSKLCSQQSEQPGLQRVHTDDYVSTPLRHSPAADPSIYTAP